MEILDDSLQSLEKAVGRLTKHGIFGHRLEFIGLCRECRKKEENSE
ncbi:MAG: hypothetical protein JRF59_15985 [Deltaproteobacteria bacterium]|nr:hypothetical protein [Deltaproteobacteria bacterium]MBW1924706.1 hypothetical protein [Deltaproteobacteria bacterium]MBW1950922.1 hypothetical protein [Deltaproteobacteria bacterium]MBW2006728.1 hypothetical protein [Deltaproteobacteria bacterium]MBW2103614.1 hypothetical protein [Deltaproteobacteria bacterium]